MEGLSDLFDELSQYALSLPVTGLAQESCKGNSRIASRREQPNRKTFRFYPTLL